MAIDCAFIATVIKGAERRVGKSGKPYVWMLARVGHGDDAEAVSVMVFGSAVDDMENVGPGDKVYCEGVIGLNEWEKNGQKHHGLSVMSWRCGPQKIGRKKERKPKKDTAVHNTHAPLQPDFDDPDAWRVGLDSERRYA